MTAFRKSALLRRLFPLVYLLVLSIGARPYPAYANDPNVNNVADSAKADDMDIMSVILFANYIRLEGVRDPGKLVATDGSRAFSSKWKQEIMPAFDDNAGVWKDFFASSIIFPGRIQRPNATIGYYNPWSDTSLFLQVNFADSQITDGIVLCGEVLRGENLMANALEYPAWQSQNTSLALALRDVYLRTEQSIEALYPLQAPAAFLPQPLLDRIGSPQKQLLSAKTRMSTRSAMTRKITEPGQGSLESATGAKIWEILEAVRANDPHALEALPFQAQRPEVTKDIFTLPEDVLAKMAPAYFVALPDGAVVALVSEATPAIFLSVYMKRSSTGDIVVNSVEAFRFDRLHLLK